MERIKGFTIELELDNMKVDSGLTDLKTSMRQMNSEMRLNMSQFDFGEKSLKKYGVQLDGLNKKYELQKVVVDDARKRYEALRKERGENHSETQKAAAAYNHEVAQLNNLERYIGKVTKEMQAFKREQEIQSSTLWKTGEALEGFGSHLDSISSKAREVGGNLTRYLTAPIVGIVATVGGMGFKRAMDIEQVDMMIDHISDSKKEAETRMNDIVDLVTDTRFGTAEVGEQYAKFIGASAEDTSANIYSQVAMNLSAFKSDDQLIPQIGDLFTKALQSGKIDGQMINQFTNAGVDIIKVLGNKWGMTTDETRKRLQSGSIDIHEVLDELSEGILEGTEGELGVTKAMGGMLERSGETLSGQLKNFFAAVSQTGERLIKDTGLFDGVKEGLSEVREMLKSGELDSILLPTFSGISKALEALVDIARKVFKWFSNLSDSTKEWIGKLVGFAVVLGPVITALGIFGGIVAKVSTGLGKFFKFLAPILKPLKTVGAAADGTGKSVGLLSRVFTFLTGPVGIAIGVITLLVTAFITAYKKSETFRKFIHKLGDKIKEIFSQIMDWVQPGIDAVVKFFGEMQEKFQEFMKNEGPALQEAFDNIKKVLAIVGKFIADKVIVEFEKLQKMIEFVMPYVADIVSNAWQNIKAYFEFGLEVLMGAIKIFSGVFTGDWEKVWEAFGDIGQAAMELVWHFLEDTWIGDMITSLTGFDGDFNTTISDMWINVKKKFAEKASEVYESFSNSFVGRIILGVIGFVMNFRQNISSLWERVKALFKHKINEIYNNLKESFIGRIILGIVKFAVNFRKNISDMWEGAKRKFKEKINEIFNNLKNSFVGRIITNVINFSTDFKKNISDMWKNIKKSFSDKITEISRAISNSFVGDIIKSVKTLKDDFIKLASDMWKGVKKKFDDIVKGAKELPGRIGKGIRGAKDKAVNGMKNVGNGIISSAGKPFNKVVDGVNWITGKLGVDKKIARWDYPQYAKGTGPGGHKGGIAMIGEKGRELVKLPGGQSFVSPDSHTLLDLPKGTQVIPNKPTEDILKSDLPHYSKGTKGWMSVIGDVWEYIKNPKSIIDKMWENISIGTGLAEVPRNLASAGVSYLKDKPKEFIKKMFDDSGGGGKPAFKWPMTSPFGYRIHPITGQRRLHGGVDFGAPGGSPIPSTTGGTVSFAGWNSGGFGNLVKVRQGMWEMLYAHMSKVLVNAGQSVKKGDILGLVGSTGASTGNHLHYETRKNGQRINPMSLKGFKTGGLIKSKMMAMLGEEGEEIVIPTARNRRTDAMKLLALAAKKIGADKGSFTRPSGMSGRGNNGYKELLEATLEQNNILMQLLNKNQDLYMKDRVVGGIVAPIVDEHLERDRIRREKFRG